MTGEIVPKSDALAPYRQLDPSLILGAIPITQCLELTETCGNPEDLPPDARYDWAWLALETSLAMAGSSDPSSGREFMPKQVQEATSRARSAFRSVVRDPEASLATGVRAQIAMASVPIYHEALTRSKTRIASPHAKPYLAALYGAAQSLAELSELSPEEIELANIVTTIGIATEIVYDHAYFLPAASRQSWHINGITRHGGTGSKIIVSEEPSPDLMVIHPRTLTTPALEANDGPSQALTAFARQKIGFGIRGKGVLRPGQKPVPQKKPTLEEVGLLKVGDQIIATLNEQRNKGVRAVVAAGALAVTAPETNETPVDTHHRPEISWYTSQAANSIQGMPRKHFLTHLESLAGAAEHGELNPLELQTLAWMQVDNARSLAGLAAAEANAAAREQSQIVRASPTRGQEHRRKAEHHQTRHTELLAEADAQFKAANEALQAALARTSPEHAGDACKISLDAEAIPVYKALFMPSTPEQLQSIVDTYLHRVASLAPQLRDSIKPVRKNSQQLDSIMDTSARAAIILLLTGATEEAARHLVVPTGPRAAGRHGRADAFIFPIDYSVDDAVPGYDTANSITLNLIPGSDKVTPIRQHIDLGRQKLAKANSAIIPLTLRLASVVRTFKGGRNKRQSHGESMNTIALQLSDAVADATS